MTKIVLAGPRATPERVVELQRQFPEVQLVVPVSRDDVIGEIGDADGFYGSIRDPEYRAAEQLRWIQSSGAGVEWLWRVPGLQQSDVVVTNMRGAHAATIAEHAFAFLLTHTRALKTYDDYQRREEWARGLVGGQMFGIKGLTMGIIGFGNIGRAIARRATGFEMSVLAVDSQSVPASDGVETVWPLDRLNEMCKRSNVLVIDCPITPETRGLVGREQIGLMGRGSYLLAMSRGGIVDEPALIGALESGHIAAAGLDVTETEPLPAGDPLWKAPNLIITPHVSATSALTSDLVWSILSENLGRFVRGEPMANVVDKARGY